MSAQAGLFEAPVAATEDEAAESRGYFRAFDEHGCLVALAFAESDTARWVEHGWRRERCDEALLPGPLRQPVGCREATA